MQGLAGKTDLDESKAAMIAETAEEIFLLPVFGFFTEKDKEKQVCIYIVFFCCEDEIWLQAKIS